MAVHPLPAPSVRVTKKKFRNSGDNIILFPTRENADLRVRLLRKLWTAHAPDGSVIGDPS